jgi:hypothetical protein
MNGSYKISGKLFVCRHSTTRALQQGAGARAEKSRWPKPLIIAAILFETLLGIC